MLHTVLAITFAIVVGQHSDRVRIYYPTEKNVTLLEVCIVTEGHGDPDKGESSEPWYRQSCWPPPDRASEEYRLPQNTYWVMGLLRLVDEGQQFTLQTRPIRTRPEPR